MMTDITKQFRLYAPQSTKSYTTSDDGGLIIEGIASTTNKDLTGDVVLPSAIQSMKQQLFFIQYKRHFKLHKLHSFSLFHINNNNLDFQQ